MYILLPNSLKLHGETKDIFGENKDMEFAPVCVVPPAPLSLRAPSARFFPLQVTPVPSHLTDRNHRPPGYRRCFHRSGKTPGAFAPGADGFVFAGITF